MPYVNYAQHGAQDTRYNNKYRFFVSIKSKNRSIFVINVFIINNVNVPV